MIAKPSCVNSSRRKACKTRSISRARASACTNTYRPRTYSFFPTEYEGFSLALVEALACAMPVAVTAVGAAPDLIRHGQNGFLFPPKDKAAMLTVLNLALEQRPRWPAIGEAARDSVAPFDLKVVADRYSELCSEPLPGEK
jgi:glycosyltransferase involved in cell wall biosynthesis